MKIRIGVGAGGASVAGDTLAELVRGLDELGFDLKFFTQRGGEALGIRCGEDDDVAADLLF